MSEISNSPPTRNHGGLLKPIILVACVEAKADKPGKAEDFYRSPYFKKCLTWARSVATDHCIRIVSGKYGLLRLNDQVEPYDQKLQQSGHLSLQQIASEKEIWFVGGGSYFEKLKVDLPQLRWVFEELPPGADTRGIGRQEVWLVEHLGKLPNVKTTTLDWALFYAKHYGWVSFPAKRGEKSSHKSAEFSTNGQRWGASSDLQQIRHDHQRWPDADLGIPTGNVNGIVVLETDTKAGHPDLEQEGEVTLQQLEAIEQDKVPETLTAISPSGSLHRYFRLPSPIRREQLGLTTIPSMNGKLGPGIDLKGEGGMVIAPPSRGGGYCWVNERPPVELPWWLLRRIADLSSPPSSNNNERREEEYRHLTRRQRAADREVKLIEINAMLAGIHPDIHREAWIQIGCALFRELGAVDGRKVWQSWSGSKGSRKYRAGKWSDQCEKQWASIIKKDYNFTIDTIRHYFKTMAYRPEIYHELMGAFDQQFIDGVNNTYTGALSGEADVICDDPKWSELYDSVDNFFVEWLKKNRKNKDEQNKDEQSDPAPDGGQPKPDPEPAPEVKEEWPTLGAAAYHGFAGEVVNTIRPHSEADPVALLIQFLICFGNAIGRLYYYQVESDRHYTNQFGILIGATRQRKQVALNRIRAIVKIGDEYWEQDRIKGGLSSGEGLVDAVRDGTGENNPGVFDKRLLVVEPEFASVLTVAERPGNTLTTILRKAWDGGMLEIMTRRNPLRATGAHISAIGHITADELRSKLTRTDMANGFANRFLFALVRRSKELPFGGNLADSEIQHLGDQLKAIIDELTANPATQDIVPPDPQRVTMTEAARAEWAGIYSALSADRPGLLGAVVGRGEPQTLRLALIYALLDRAKQIDVVHLRAALAVWKYCEASARHVFGSTLGDEMADAILRALVSAGKRGISRTTIVQMFYGHKNKAKLDIALALLLKHGVARFETRPTMGRPVEVWLAV